MANIQKDQSSQQKEQNTNKTHEQQLQEEKRKKETNPNNPVAGAKNATQTETDNQRKAGFHSPDATKSQTSEQESNKDKSINWQDNNRTDRSERFEQEKTNKRTPSGTTDDEDAELQQTTPGKPNKGKTGL